MAQVSIAALACSKSGAAPTANVLNVKFDFKNGGITATVTAEVNLVGWRVEQSADGAWVTTSPEHVAADAAGVFPYKASGGAKAITADKPSAGPIDPPPATVDEETPAVAHAPEVEVRSFGKKKGK